MFKNFLKHRARTSLEPNQGSRFPLEQDNPFDLDRTKRLAQLFLVDPAARDDAWSDLFYDAAWNAALSAPAEPVFQGPDGFPYLRLNIPDRLDVFEANSLCNVIRDMVDQAVGVAFFASAAHPVERPQYVMSMGVLDSILQFDDPRGDPLDQKEMTEEIGKGVERLDSEANRDSWVITEDQTALVGTPSSDYLSPAAARALERHLRDGWGMADPRVGLIMIPALKPSRALVIGKSAEEFRGEGIEDDLRDERVRMLSWYLPPLRRLMLRPDDFALDDMTPLSRLSSA